MKGIAQGHTVREWLSQDRAQGLLGEEVLSPGHSFPVGFPPIQGELGIPSSPPLLACSVPWHSWDFHEEGFPRKDFPEFAVPGGRSLGAPRFTAVLSLGHQTRGSVIPKEAGSALCVTGSACPLVPCVLRGTTLPTQL